MYNQTLAFLVRGGARRDLGARQGYQLAHCESYHIVNCVLMFCIDKISGKK